MYPFSPVFPCRIGGRRAVLKRTRGAPEGEVHWVAYPFMAGRAYAGRLPEMAAAGELLGRMHAAGAGPAVLPVFQWPDHDQARVSEDVDLLRTVMAPTPRTGS